MVVGCGGGPPPQPTIGEAFVGPVTLKIRSDIPLQSAPVATVKHGDRLEILQRRRRFFKVRTPGGAIGWTDERQLLAADDMAALRELSKRAARLPAQGQATTFGELNIHTQPTRSAPSFLQIKEGQKVDVLEHVVTPQKDAPRKPLLPPPPKKVAKAPKKPPKKEKYPAPPMPKPPEPPPNWLELSRSDKEEPAPGTEEPDTDAQPEATDEWSLVRIPGGQSGWARTRRLVMAIPDEVAQYAEGRRIVSYFSLATIEDEDQKKHVWLWTTVADGLHPYDFDSLRVFIWNLRRHRYETAYIERNVKGFAPVLLKDVEYGTPVKGKAQAAKYPGFSVCFERADGSRSRREYVLLGNIVRSAGETPCEAPVSVEVKAHGALPAETADQAPAESWWQRVKRKLKR